MSEVSSHASQANSTPPFSQRRLAERLGCCAKTCPGRIVFTTSFGIEDQALTHAFMSEDLDFEFATLDTGRLFPGDL